MAAKLDLGYSLTHVITSEFEKLRKEDDRFAWSFANPTTAAMKLTFRLPVNYDVEDGYRHLDLYLFSPLNYVMVGAVARWSVARAEEFNSDDADPNYVEGKTDVHVLGYHDSCWRDAVQRLVLADHRDLSMTLEARTHWYEIIDMQEEFPEISLQSLVEQQSTLDSIVASIFKFPMNT